MPRFVVINYFLDCFNCFIISAYSLILFLLSSTKSDVAFIKERLSVIKENTNCEKITVDGGYYCENPTGDV